MIESAQEFKAKAGWTGRWCHAHTHTSIMDKSGFRAMLLAVSDQLDDETLDSLKFLCKEDIGKKKLEKVTKGIELFECLIERARLGPENTDLLRKHLEKVGRAELLEIIDSYETGSLYAPANVLDPVEQEKINIATDVLVDHLGRNWKKVGRKLGLNDIKLDSLEDKHSRDLEELVRDLIKVWMKIQKENATVETLIKALRDCRQNYTADVIEKKLQDTDLK